MLSWARVSIAAQTNQNEISEVILFNHGVSVIAQAFLEEGLVDEYVPHPLDLGTLFDFLKLFEEDDDQYGTRKMSALLLGGADKANGGGSTYSVSKCCQSSCHPRKMWLTTSLCIISVRGSRAGSSLTTHLLLQLWTARLIPNLDEAHRFARTR